jgi:hypothetical protein
MREPIWMSSAGVTAADARDGMVLVMQERPRDGLGVCVWAVEARAGQSLQSLVRALERNAGVSRHSTELGARALQDYAAAGGLPVRVVIECADRLPPRTLARMHTLAELLNGVVLVGDLMTIGAKTRGQERFMRWARFCVSV